MIFYEDATFTFQLLGFSHKLFDSRRSRGLQVSRHASLLARAGGFFSHTLLEQFMDLHSSTSILAILPLWTG